MRFQGPEMTLPGGKNLGKLVDWKAQVLDLTEEGRSGVDGDQVEAGWSVGRSTGLGEVKSGR